MTAPIVGSMIPSHYDVGLPVSGDLVVFCTPTPGTLWERIAESSDK